MAFSSLTRDEWSSSEESVPAVKLDSISSDERAEYYRKRGLASVEERDFEIGSGLLNLVMERLLISKSKRSQVKAHECTPAVARGEGFWWPAFKSRLVLWGALAEAGKRFTELREVRVGEERDTRVCTRNRSNAVRRLTRRTRRRPPKSPRPRPGRRG